MGMPVLPLVAFIDLVGDGLWLAALMVMVGFGFRYGFFLAVLSALIVVTAAMAGVGLSPGLASHLELMGMPARVTLPAAYFALLALVVVLGRLALGAVLTEEDVRFRPLADRVGGVLFGAFAGMLLGGALLVGWSMCEVPGSLRAESPSMQGDSATRLIAAMLRLVESNDASRRIRLDGDPWARGSDGKVIRASEPFADVNDDWKRDEHEPYLDHDGNGSFTVDQPIVDLPEGTPDVRDAGLLDRYRLSAWRSLRVLHRPRITSPSAGQAPGATEPAAAVHQVRAADVDAHDKLVFRLKTGEDDDEPLLQIDPDTGDVRFRDQEVDPSLEAVGFIVVVTDRSGLTDEQKVLVTLNPPSVTSALP